MADQKDEKTPLEAEILREVAEEMKEEQLKALWKKIGPVVTGLIAAALLVTGGIEFYRYRQEQRALAESEQLQTALTLIESGDAENGAEMLKTLSETSTRGYRYLAAFQYADYLIGQGKDKYPQAVETLNTVIEDDRAPQPFRNMALFDKIILRIESGDQDFAGMEAELDQLAAKSNAWTPLALEIAAELALRRGDVEKAKSRWQQILGMPSVSEAKRLQVSEYISFVDETMPQTKQTNDLKKDQKTEK